MYAEGQILGAGKSFAGGAALGGSSGNYDGLRNAAVAQDVRHGEIEGQIHRLLVTAETLENCVASLLGRASVMLNAQRDQGFVVALAPSSGTQVVQLHRAWLVRAV